MLPSRVPPITYLSLAVACFSLATAMYQGYVQTRNLEAVQRDINRRELIRGCRDVIEAYFEAKLRIGLLAEAARTGADMARHAEATAVAQSRFAAIGTFLANGQAADARARYTDLSHELERLVREAHGGKGEGGPERFRTADGLFRGMNDDCVNAAQAAPA